MKRYADKNRGNYKEFDVGDTVLVKNQNNRKFDPIYQPIPFKVVKQKGSSILV